MSRQSTESSASSYPAHAVSKYIHTVSKYIRLLAVKNLLGECSVATQVSTKLLRSSLGGVELTFEALLYLRGSSVSPDYIEVGSLCGQDLC